jgi:3-oxoacyl-[acyl-carrier-protein] synthase-1
MSRPITIAGSGWACAVGLDPDSATAAVRCGLAGFTATEFWAGGEPVRGAPTPWPDGQRGRDQLLALAGRALAQALPADWLPVTPVLACLAEEGRPGRDDGFTAAILPALAAALGGPLHPWSLTAPTGRGSLGAAVRLARTWVASGAVPALAVVAADTLLTGPVIAAHAATRWIATASRPEGIIPGTGAAAVELVGDGRPGLRIRGLGQGDEPSDTSDAPERGLGLTAALRQALAEADCGADAIDLRISDGNGGPLHARELSLAWTRLGGGDPPLWLPADQHGDTGAAMGLGMLALAHTAVRRGWAPGRRCCVMISNGYGFREAVILEDADHGP